MIAPDPSELSDGGLFPAVIRDSCCRDVLRLAWMSADSHRKSIVTPPPVYEGIALQEIAQEPRIER